MKDFSKIKEPPLYPLVKELYSVYKENCYLFDVIPLSRRKFRRRVLLLNNLGIIDFKLLLDKKFTSIIDELYTPEAFNDFLKGVDRARDNQS